MGYCQAKCISEQRARDFKRAVISYQAFCSKESYLTLCGWVGGINDSYLRID